MLNSVNLTGRITHDLELKYTNDGDAVLGFRIAVNRIGSEETDFFNVTAWRKQAENVCQYLGKGSLVGVEGNLRAERYKDRDGNNREAVKVNARFVHFLEKRGEQSQSPPKQEDDTYVPSDDDVPF